MTGPQAPLHIVALRLPGHIGPRLGTPALLNRESSFLLEEPGRASGCTLVPLPLNGIYTDLLNAEGRVSFFSRPYGARCPAVMKSTPVHAAQKLRACSRITMFQVSHCLLLFQFTPQRFALFFLRHLRA